jgi:hypothetical protein
MIDEQKKPTNDERINKIHSHYNPVTVTSTDSFGAIILGALAFILLIALLRAQGRNRALLSQLSEQMD